MWHWVVLLMIYTVTTASQYAESSEEGVHATGSGSYTCAASQALKKGARPAKEHRLDTSSANRTFRYQTPQYRWGLFFEQGCEVFSPVLYDEGYRRKDAFIKMKMSFWCPYNGRMTEPRVALRRAECLYRIGGISWRLGLPPGCAGVMISHRCRKTVIGHGNNHLCFFIYLRTDTVLRFRFHDWIIFTLRL